MRKQIFIWLVLINYLQSYMLLAPPFLAMIGQNVCCEKGLLSQKIQTQACYCGCTYFKWMMLCLIICLWWWTHSRIVDGLIKAGPHPTVCIFSLLLIHNLIILLCCVLLRRSDMTKTKRSNLIIYSGKLFILQKWVFIIWTEGQH